MDVWELRLSTCLRQHPQPHFRDRRRSKSHPYNGIFPYILKLMGLQGEQKLLLKQICKSLLVMGLSEMSDMDDHAHGWSEMKR